MAVLSSHGQGQTNKILGRITMQQHGVAGAMLPTDHMPAERDAGGSPNQFSEREAVKLRDAYQRKDQAAIARAKKRCLDLLAYQRQHGHQLHAEANEFMTNSHAPIWCRGMGSMTVTAYDLGDAELVTACSDWWSCQYTACKAAQVKSGSKAGSIVSVGARYRAGGDDTVRDVVIGLLDGEAASHLAGGKFWKNALVYQDTFGAELVRRLVAAGHAKDLATLLPSIPCAGTYVVDYFEDGHTTYADNLQAGDPGAVSVRYSTGEVTVGPDGGQLGRRTGEKALWRAK